MCVLVQCPETVLLAAILGFLIARDRGCKWVYTEENNKTSPYGGKNVERCNGKKTKVLKNRYPINEGHGIEGMKFGNSLKVVCKGKRSSPFQVGSPPRPGLCPHPKFPLGTRPSPCCSLPRERANTLPQVPNVFIEEDYPLLNRRRKCPVQGYLGEHQVRIWEANARHGLKILYLRPVRFHTSRPIQG